MLEYMIVHVLINVHMTAWKAILFHDNINMLLCMHVFVHVNRSISFELQRQRMIAALKENQPVCFLPFFKESLVEKRELDILKTLDEGEFSFSGLIPYVYY